MRKRLALSLMLPCLAMFSCSSPSPEVDRRANGTFTYASSDGKTKTELTGALERYAVDTKLNGITLYGNGSFLLFDSSVQKGTDKHIPGYGFGVIQHGAVTADLSSESNPAWRRYYHIALSSDSHLVNEMDDKTAFAQNLTPYLSAPYYETQLTESRDSFEYVGRLSTRNRPVAVNPDVSGNSSTWRVYVKTGSKAKYGTLSEANVEFDGREVELEDYLTPYKILYTQAYGMALAGENLTGPTSLAGTYDYFHSSASGFNEEAWANVGIKGIDGDDPYLEFSFNEPLGLNRAMEFFQGHRFAPVPASFIQKIGGGDFALGTDRWGKLSDGVNGDILDHWLSTGPYVIEQWNKDSAIVLKKNTQYALSEDCQIKGVHVSIIPTVSDPEAIYKAFLSGKLHESVIPRTKVANHLDDPRLAVTSSTLTFRLQINACNEGTWESLFGEHGSVKQTPKEDYWIVEPAMSDPDFVSGLSFAFDRKAIANAVGRAPSADFFGDDYFTDFDSCVPYNASEAHKKAVEPLRNGADEYGFSLQKAKDSFISASRRLIQSGAYQSGDTISLEIAWQTQAQVDREHALVSSMLESAFNVDENPLRLRVVPWVSQNWSDVFYQKMMTGQFDLAFGSISGGAMTRDDLLQTLRSDNTTSFTLSWATDTNGTERLIDFDDKLWTFDALAESSRSAAHVVDGVLVP